MAPSVPLKFKHRPKPRVAGTRLIDQVNSHVEDKQNAGHALSTDNAVLFSDGMVRVSEYTPALIYTSANQFRTKISSP